MLSVIRLRRQRLPLTVTKKKHRSPVAGQSKDRLPFTVLRLAENTASPLLFYHISMLYDFFRDNARFKKMR